LFLHCSNGELGASGGGRSSSSSDSSDHSRALGVNRPLLLGQEELVDNEEGACAADVNYDEMKVRADKGKSTYMFCFSKYHCCTCSGY